MNSQSSMQDSVPARLARVREVMASEGVDALLVPSADPHLSEYLPGYWQARQWLSGFHGSVGTLVVARDFSGLWVDSRYWEQAESELAGSGIQLMKLRPGQPGPLDWLADEVPLEGSVAVDGSVMALASARQLEGRLKARKIRLLTHLDLPGSVWSERPVLPGNPVYEHLPPQASVSRVDKLAGLRRDLQARKADWHFIAALDDIAWLFNLRGSDVSYNPVFVSFALVSGTQASLYVALDKIDDHLRRVLELDGVQLHDYADIGPALAAIGAGSSLLIDPARVTIGLLEHLGSDVRLVEALNPSTLSKSRKSESDLVHIRQAMEHDGAALCEFFAWFEAQQGRQVLTELDEIGRASCRERV